MASIMKSSKHLKERKNAPLPVSALLSYLFIATLILSGVSLARYTATSSENVSVRAASFSVSATMQDVRNNEIVLTDGEECRFEVANGSDVSVVYKALIKGVPAGVNVTLTVGEESIPMTPDPENASELISAGKVLESDKTDVCTLSFTASEEVAGIHNVSVQVQFDQID